MILPVQATSASCRECTKSALKGLRKTEEKVMTFWSKKFDYPDAENKNTN